MISIKELRARHDVTQKEFADSLGVSTTTVTNWEKDQLSISGKNIVKISKIYDISPSDLLSQ